jgi:hypothetical protein
MFNLKPPHSIFVHADGFLKTTSYLNKAPGDPNFDPLCFSALVATTAFASELYLKCLIQIETQMVVRKEHNLRTLFSKLPNNTQEEIEKRFVEWQGTEPQNVYVMMAKELQEAADNRPKTFREALKAGANAFVEWRYLYESNETGNAFGLFPLPSILRSVILKRMPQWGTFRIQMTKIADAQPTSQVQKNQTQSAGPVRSEADSPEETLHPRPSPETSFRHE